MREYTTPAVVEVAPSARLTDVVFDRAAQHPDTVVLRRKAGLPAAGGRPDGAWQDVTARRFRDEVAALAKGLIAAGIGIGDRIGLMSRTRYEWTLTDYAIWAAGAVTVPIYETSSAEQVEWILGDSGASAVVVETPAHQQAIAEALRRLPAVRQLWLIEGGPVAAADDDGRDRAGSGPTARSLAALTDAGATIGDGDLETRRTSRTAADLATVIYTSGTTGRPKGCELTHANLLFDGRSAVYGPLADIVQASGASTLLFLPLAHVLARVIQVGVIESTAVLGHSPDPRATVLLPDLASFRPTFILAVPRVFEKVYNTAEQQASPSPVKGAIFRAATATAIAWSQAFGTHEADGREAGAAGASTGPGAGLRMRHALFDRLVYSKLRAAVGGRAAFAISGGAPLGERLGHFFRGAGITILEGYGLTESTAAATVNRPDHNKIGTVGQPLPGVSARIADDGEVLIKGPNVFVAYWRNARATAEALTEDGWLRTGDLGDLDDDGYLRVTGRKKELIVTAGGKNVAPAVLEDRIRAHPLVSQCVVVGDNRPYVACLITLDEEALGMWKERHSRPASVAATELRGDPALLAELQAAVDDANRAVSRAEAIRRFRVLAGDLTEQDGYLTPSLKVRRSVVIKDFADEIDALYS